MATAKTKKIEMFPDEVFLRAAIKDGRAVKKELSLKAIGTPDTRLQQRVEMNVDHVRKLERILHDDGNLRPIIVFEEQEPYKLHVADGFHRHAAHKNARRESIWAWVIQGTYRDAMIYSTMCNQDMCLKRTPEDIKKAVFTLLDDEEWRGKSDAMIGKHCGVSGNTAARHRAEHCESRGIPFPEVIERSDGTQRPYRKSTNKPTLTHRRNYRGKRGGFIARVGGGRVCLGTDHEEAQKKLDAIVSEREKKRSLLRGDELSQWLVRRNIWLEPANLGRCTGLGSVRHSDGLVLVTAEFKRRQGGQFTSEAPESVGRILLARHMIDPAARAVVVCYVEDAPPELIEAGRALGVEFLTPEELVASLTESNPCP